jgi:CubicO group peptidase (beta-lactamase class C family)
MPLFGLVALTVMTMSAAADPIDDWVRAFMQKDHVPGVSLGVYRGGRPLKVAVYGMADLEQGAKVRLESRFEIASITKQFTAVLTLLLAEDG